MAKLATPRRIRRCMSNQKKAKHQQNNQRGDTLFRKAFEFCQECDADVSLTVRLRNNGQIFMFNLDDRWHPSPQDLAAYYPVPLRVTWQELAAKYDP
ncbi:hypothetical protein BDW71DRAFT_193097 [Aspergillus fruticulosus]